jgi:hypothetical protein
VVRGTTASASMTASPAGASSPAIAASGSGCPAGTAVEVRIDEASSVPPASVEVVAAADGTWSAVLPVDTLRLAEVYVAADCGNPTDQGFVYVVRKVRVDPSDVTTTSAPPTGPPPATPVDGAASLTG